MTGGLQPIAESHDPQSLKPRAPSGSLTSCRESTHVRVGHAQILVRIHRDVVDAHFVVKMWAGAASAVANVADGVAAVHMLSGINREALHVSIASGDAVAVVKNDRASVSAHEVGELDDTLSGRHDWLPVNRADIHTRVERAFTVERINAFAE